MPTSNTLPEAETVGRKWEIDKFRPDYRIHGANCNKWRTFAGHHRGCHTIEQARGVIHESKRIAGQTSANVGGLPVRFPAVSERYEYRIVRIVSQIEVLELL